MVEVSSSLWKELQESLSSTKSSAVLCLDLFEAFLKDRQLEELQILSVSDYECFSAVVMYVSNFGLVQDFSEKEERDYDVKDFPGIASSAVQSLKFLKELLSKLIFKFFHYESYKKFLLAVLKLCATHYKTFLWSNDVAVSLSYDVLQAVLHLTGYLNFNTLLCGQEKGQSETVLKHILLTMRPSLLKETWTRNPSNCQIFKWLLLNIKHPYLVEYLPDVLPPALMFTDHHAMQNKVLGIECLYHIIDNVPPSKLKLYGRADVVYDVLFHLVYYKELEVIHILYPCILLFLKGQQPPNQRELQKWSRIDDVYHQLMWNMELEDKILFRREYSAHVADFIEYMRLRVVVHLKRTLRVLENYLGKFDGPEEITRINSLKAVKALIKAAEPRMEHNCVAILKLIMFFLYDTETDRGTSVPEVKKKILDLSHECLFLLKKSCPERFKSETSVLVKTEEDIPAVDILRLVYDDNS